MTKIVFTQIELVVYTVVNGVTTNYRRFLQRILLKFCDYDHALSRVPDYALNRVLLLNGNMSKSILRNVGKGRGTKHEKNKQLHSVAIFSDVFTGHGWGKAGWGRDGVKKREIQAAHLAAIFL